MTTIVTIENGSELNQVEQKGKREARDRKSRSTMAVGGGTIITQRTIVCERKTLEMEAAGGKVAQKRKLEGKKSSCSSGWGWRSGRLEIIHGHLDTELKLNLKRPPVLRVSTPVEGSGNWSVPKGAASSEVWLRELGPRFNFYHCHLYLIHSCSIIRQTV